MLRNLDQDRDVIISTNPGKEIISRAVIAVLLFSPAKEIELTINRSRELLEYSLLTRDTWIKHPLRADMEIDITTVESRAR